MEEKNNAATKINCVMVLYDYYNMGVTIFEHIKQLAAPVNLYGIVTSYEQIQDLSSVDLIITALPENPDLGIPTIKVQMLPTKQDYETILLKASELIQNIHHRELSRQIQQIFKKELFFPHTNFSSREEQFDTYVRRWKHLIMWIKLFIRKSSIMNRWHLVLIEMLHFRIH
uniref:hypothetical protein n=1 Tax=Enterocloster clostridioformis TaxID=1531 RepID=UPI002674E914|nr:hypothetical protein [Enterocloster clostridioformis]